MAVCGMSSCSAESGKRKDFPERTAKDVLVCLFGLPYVAVIKVEQGSGGSPGDA